MEQESTGWEVTTFEEPATSTEMISQKADELVESIAKAETKEELEDLYQRFNILNTKKNALRVNELNNLLDMVNKQAVERFKRRPDEIANKEILDYMTAIQNQIERSQKTVDSIKDVTAIQVNNTQNNTVNIQVGDSSITYLSKESRDKITNLISSILEENQNNIVLDMTEESENNTLETDEVKPVIDIENEDFEGDE